MSYQLKRLLPRHRKLMDLMLTGMTQKEAAARLMISKRCASYTVNSAVFQAELRRRARERDEGQAQGFLDRIRVRPAG